MVLLPTRSSTASICLASAIRWERPGPSSLGPLTSTHVHFGVVDPKRLDFDHHLTGDGLRLGQLLVDEAFRSAKFLDNDGTHRVFSYL